MFNLNEAIARWRQELLSEGLTRTAYLEELEGHLREDMEQAAGAGVNPEAAFERAVRQLGDRKALAAEFQKAAKAQRRHILRRGLACAAVVLACSSLFCYFVLLPLVLSAETAYLKWLGFFPPQLPSDLFVHRVYTVFAARLVLGMSLALEVPVILVTLVKMGVVDQHWLSRTRKYALLLNLVVVSRMAGPGVLPQLAVFLLLQVVYELSVWLAGRWASPARTLASEAAA